LQPFIVIMNKRKLIISRPINQITVLLADDHASFRKSLKLLLERDVDIQVVGEAKNGLEAVRLNRKLHPAVIVMDLTMPILNGLQATVQIMETSPGPRILILSAHSDSEYIKQAVICGASGYLIKQSSTHVLAQAVRQVIEGNAFFFAPIARHLRATNAKKLIGKGELIKRQTALLAAAV
jgi:DNA-binding NarL/FixJ family response regulator